MIGHYVKTAFRSLRKRGYYTFINVTGLSIGMAGCLMMLTHVRDELSYDRYHENADRIHRIVIGSSGQMPAAMGPALQHTFPGVENSVRMMPPAGQWMMRAGDQVFYERRVYWADHALLDVFTFPLIEGNSGTALKAPYTVIITKSTAEKYFGADDPVGKTITADDLFDLTVTGVIRDIPSNSHIQADFFISMVTRTAIYEGDPLTLWTDRRYFTYLLLDNSADKAELERKLPEFLDIHIPFSLKPEGRPFLQPVLDIHVSSNLVNELSSNTNRVTLVLVTSVAVVLMLIACFNYVNLSTALSTSRLREFRIRIQVGADIRRLLEQNLVESTLISLCAFLFAIGIVQLTLPAFNVWLGKSYALSGTDWSPDWLGIFSVMLILSVLSGTYPSVMLFRTRSLITPKHTPLSGRGSFVLRKGLVTVQFIVTVVVVVATGVMYQQLSYVRTKSMGFTDDPVIVITATIDGIQRKYEALKEELLRSPGVIGVTGSLTVPGNVGGRGILRTYKVRSKHDAAGPNLEIPMLFADLGLIETLGLSMTEGELYSSNPANGIVINETAAIRLGWDPPESAVDQMISMETQWNDGVFRVTGVVRDFHMKSLHQPIAPLMIARTVRYPGYILIRLHPDREDLALEDLEHTWNKLLPQFPLLYAFMDDLFDQQYRSEEMVSMLLAGFAFMMLFIACLGLVGLVAYSTRNRAREIGIRKVLGGSVADVVVLLTWDYLVLVLTAILFAVPIAYITMTYWLRNFAFRIEPGIAPFVLGGIFTLVMVLFIVGYHTVRSAIANPVKTIRSV